MAKYPELQEYMKKHKGPVPYELMPPEYEIWDNVSFQKHFQFPGREEEALRQHLEQTRTLMLFLQSHGLTTRQLMDPNLNDINLLRDFCLRVKDLTKEGYEFYRVGEQRWLKGQDRGNATDDARILERNLKRMRGEAGTKSKRTRKK